MTDEELQCWRCGAALTTLTPPISRQDACPGCGAELHCCRLCRWLEPRWRRGCREERAEEVGDRERANFCDYFQPRPGAHQPVADANAAARARLDSLFGGDGQDGAAAAENTAADRAREALERLFRKP